MAGAPLAKPWFTGGISDILRTLTLQAYNNGEGGIFSRYVAGTTQNQVVCHSGHRGRQHTADQKIMMPPISLSPVIEDLRILFPHIPTVPFVTAANLSLHK